MMLIYQLFLQILRSLSPLIHFVPHQKIQYFFRNNGKLKTSGELPNHPIWIHASSGEIEYAKSLVRLVKTEFPNIQILFTHTSVSSEKAVKQLDVHFWGVAPLDTSQDVKGFIAHWQPRVCLIARTDLWPQTLIELYRAQIPIFLISATFAEGSKKISFLSRQLLKSTLPLIRKIYFVSSADEKICQEYFPTCKGEIFGDTRYDQVLFHLQNSKPISLPKGEKVIVAGSTWEEDEEILVPVIAQLKQKGWKFIIVPHEVSSSHLLHLQKQLQATGLSFWVFSQGVSTFRWEDVDVLLVDRVGLLASLYASADLAFVGGSFKRQVHSVMEPLATQTPVIVGPHHHNNREALEFKELGLVREAQNVAEFIQAVESFETNLPELKPRLEKEVLGRTGTTKRILSDLKAQGVFIELPPIDRS